MEPTARLTAYYVFKCIKVCASVTDTVGASFWAQQRSLLDLVVLSRQTAVPKESRSIRCRMLLINVQCCWKEAKWGHCALTCQFLHHFSKKHPRIIQYDSSMHGLVTNNTGVWPRPLSFQMPLPRRTSTRYRKKCWCFSFIVWLLGKSAGNGDNRNSR